MCKLPRAMLFTMCEACIPHRIHAEIYVEATVWANIKFTFRIRRTSVVRYHIHSFYFRSPLRNRLLPFRNYVTYFRFRCNGV